MPPDVGARATSELLDRAVIYRELETIRGCLRLDALQVQRALVHAFTMLFAGERDVALDMVKHSRGRDAFRDLKTDTSLNVGHAADSAEKRALGTHIVLEALAVCLLERLEGSGSVLVSHGALAMPSTKFQ